MTQPGIPPAPTAPDPQLDALRAALRTARHPAAAAPLVHLRDKGLAHDHVRLAGTGLLARIPKQSQLDLPAPQALTYEAECFRRASPSGCTPPLRGLLPVSRALPRGALLVDEVPGQPARLPADLGAIARALAALHALALPPPQQRVPLLDASDALAALVTEIEGQARHAAGAAIPLPAARAIQSGLQLLHQQLARPVRPPLRLIAFDAHPGNFLVVPSGRAWLVDLEKCRYGYPGLDLAHATLYTSTTWDLDSHAALEVHEVQAFYAAWASAVDAPLAEAAAPWHAPLRRAMWLWSLTWCAKWRAVSNRPPRASAHGEDWSADRSDPALVAHVRERVGHYLGAEAVERVRAELDALEAAWTL